MRSNEPHVSSNSDYYLYTPSHTAQQLFFYPICVGYFVYEPEYFLRRNNYDSFLIMLIQKGECTITTNNGSQRALAGNVVLLDCYAPHQYESSVGWECLWLHFDGPMARAHYEHITRCFGNVLVSRNVQTVEHTLAKIYNTFRNSSRIKEASISKYITNILTEMLLSGTSREAMPQAQISLAETITYINEHFADSISLDDLASQASLSPFYFTRMFTKETGMTPHQYVIATRINAAKFLLKSSNTPVKEVAFSCGFSSESSFCTTFKKWENITPSEYRSMDFI